MSPLDGTLTLDVKAYKAHYLPNCLAKFKLSVMSIGGRRTTLLQRRGKTKIKINVYKS